MPHLEMSQDRSGAPGRGQVLYLFSGECLALPGVDARPGPPALSPQSTTCDAMPELWGGLHGGFGSLVAEG